MATCGVGTGKGVGRDDGVARLDREGGKGRKHVRSDVGEGGGRGGNYPARPQPWNINKKKKTNYHGPGSDLFKEIKSEWCGLIGNWESDLNSEGGLIIG